LTKQSIFNSIQNHYFNEISKDGPVLYNKIKKIEFKISEEEINNLEKLTNEKYFANQERRENNPNKIGSKNAYENNLEQHSSINEISSDLEDIVFKKRDTFGKEKDEENRIQLKEDKIIDEDSANNLQKYLQLKADGISEKAFASFEGKNQSNLLNKLKIFLLQETKV
jgi:hypothetical protein